MNKIIVIKNVYLPAILITNYLITTHFCNRHFPRDCIKYQNTNDLYERLTNLIINSLLIFYVNKIRKGIKFNKIYIQNNNVRPKTLNVEKCSIIESRRKKNIRIETT